MHVIIKIGLNIVLTQLVSNVLSPYFYDTKDVQILYSTKCSDLLFHISTSKYFEYTFLSMYKNYFIFLLDFGQTIFLFTLPC
jgi:hypothetical protein